MKRVGKSGDAWASCSARDAPRRKYSCGLFRVKWMVFLTQSQNNQSFRQRVFGCSFLTWRRDEHDFRNHRELTIDEGKKFLWGVFLVLFFSVREQIETKFQVPYPTSPSTGKYYLFESLISKCSTYFPSNAVGRWKTVLVSTAAYFYFIFLGQIGSIKFFSSLPWRILLPLFENVCLWWV